MLTSQAFLGRRAELEALDKIYRAEGSGFVPIYGRRRVGKSELILQFMQGKPGIYHLGKQGPAELQVKEFLQAAAQVMQEPLLQHLPGDSWKTALQTVVARWTRNRKLILALDEFQWTASASPELPSVLQECWDRHWKKTGKVLLILCGSYIGFMEREVLGKGSPLFGRRTGQILLKPFSYLEAAEFHPHYSRTDRAKTYFLCGGIPLYLRAFDDRQSVEKNLVDNLLSEFAPLAREPDFLLREELREVENYYAVLLAVASGHTSHRQIAQQSGLEERALHYYLHQLLELGYLTKRYPVSGRPAAARHVRYAVGDPLLRFWFRFVYPNTSLLAPLGGMRVFTTRIRPELDSYFGSCFESMCREALPVLYAREGITAAFDVGEYWDKTTQIDVVGVRADGWTDLGECRWGKVPSARGIAAELEGKVSRYPNPHNASIGRRIFTRQAIPLKNVKVPNIRAHSLDDLFRVSPKSGPY